MDNGCSSRIYEKNILEIFGVHGIQVLHTKIVTCLVFFQKWLLHEKLCKFKHI